MRVVYMGTPDFAVAPLEALVENSYEVALCVTKPDRPRDRGKKLQSCPVKLRALELGIPVETPEKIRDNAEFEKLIRGLEPDVVIVAAYGKILPKSILDIPRLGCINIHGSLLPKYRGAAPIQRAVMDRAEETGVTLMYMAEGLDCGDMIASVSTPVAGKTADELFAELSRLGAALLIEQLPLIEAGTAARVPQAEEEASYAPMLSKADQFLDFANDPEAESARVRALTGITRFRGENMKVYKAFAENVPSGEAPGTVISADKTGIRVSCGGGRLVLVTIQLPGKKAMDVSAFLLGNKIEKGTVLG